MADNDFLCAVNVQLEAVERRTDNKLLVALLLVLALSLVHAHFGSANDPFAKPLIGLLLFTVIACTLWRVVREKSRVAAEYGLVCRGCGHIPAAHKMLSAAATLRCPKCRAPLSGLGTAVGDSRE